jgi:hypothetical protein
VQVKSMDISRAMVPGQKNGIVLIGHGRRGDSALVTTSDRP